jgi:ELWxxDGT repeat protein
MTPRRDDPRAKQRVRRGRAARRFFPLRGEVLESRALLTLVPQLVADINERDPVVTANTPIVEANGLAFFGYEDAGYGSELWRTDGTPEGTFILEEFFDGERGSATNELTNVNGTLFFAGGDGRVLWKTDGTREGTVTVAEFYFGLSGIFGITNFVNVNGTLFFLAADGNRHHTVWKSDGTAEGTTIVKIMAADTGTDGAVSDFTNASGTLFFRAFDTTHGSELWKSDGTEGGTSLVKDIRPAGSAFPYYLTNVSGDLYFSANDGLTGVE